MAMSTVHRCFSRVWCPRGVSVDRITVYPLFPRIQWSALARPVDYVPLGDALASGQAVIKEMPTAHVPELQVKNDGPSMVLGIDGDELIGGLQNRVLNATVLLEPQRSTVIPVSCVERGRWSETRLGFAFGERLTHGMRMRAHGHVTQNLHSQRGHRSDQVALWQDVSRHHRAHGVHSHTQALHDACAARDEEFRRYAGAFECPPQSVGLLVALDGVMVGGDLFERASTAAYYWQRLIRAYAGDKGEAPISTGPIYTTPDEIIAAITRCDVDVFPTPGAGCDARLRGRNGLTGSALVFEDRVVHAAIFVTP